MERVMAGGTYCTGFVYFSAIVKFISSRIDEGSVLTIDGSQGGICLGNFLVHNSIVIITAGESPR